VSERPRNDGGIFLQDLLSNALVAVTVLTMVAMAMSGSGMGLLASRTGEDTIRSVRGQRPPAGHPAGRYERLIVQVAPEKRPGQPGDPLLAIQPQGPGVHALRTTTETADHLFVIDLPDREGGRWAIHVEQPEAIGALNWRVLADAEILFEGRQEPSGARSGSLVLTLCASPDGGVSAIPAGQSGAGSCPGEG
jgi:hypothetical protein